MPHASDPRFLVLHALRVKGFAKTDTVVELTGLAEPAVTSHLDALQGEGLVLFREARSLWQLSPSGREAHLALLTSDTVDTGVRDGLAGPYHEFLALNEEFKELCGEWQLKPSADGDLDPNDHTDAEYDAKVIARLVDVDGRAQPLCTQFGATVARFGRYGPRLVAAAERVRGGDTHAFTGVMCNSYHDIWMELHEDLILSLGIDRAKEGSF